MNMVYFGENGLTSTSANYIANKSKELFEGIQKELESISFVNVTYRVAGTDPILVESGKSLEWLNEQINQLQKVGKLKALNAWLREAISEKEKASRSIQLSSGDFTTWLKNNGKELKYEPKIELYTEDEAIKDMTIADRQKYLELEAKAANIGKLIHQDGAFNKARKQIKAMNGKKEVTGVGTASLTVSEYSSSVPMEEIDKSFLYLQEEFRSIQAELNGMKHEISLKVDAENSKRQAAYRADCAEYQAWFRVENSQFRDYLASEQQRIAAMKIVIPKNLEEIYNFVKNA